MTKFRNFISSKSEVMGVRISNSPTTDTYSTYLYAACLRPIKLDLQFLAQNSGKMIRAGGYYSLFITAENHALK